MTGGKSRLGGFAAARQAGRAPAAAALLVAFLVAGCVTAAVAYAIRPLRDGSSERERATVVAAVAEAPAPNATTAPAPSLTPTPRVVATRPPATSESQPTATAAAKQRATPTATPAATRTPKPKPKAKPTPQPTATVAPLYVAAGDDLAGWTGPHWGFANGLLQNDGGGLDAQPWLAGPFQPPGSRYAVEAEIRVAGLAGGVCEQNFGVVAGGGSGVVWGGGVIFGCDGGRRAHLTDVSDWSDGYNRDRELGGGDFDPGNGWHRYRLEVDGGHVRLLIDGKAAVDATDGAAAGAAGSSQVGLWSQGVRIDVRRVAVVAP